MTFTDRPEAQGAGAPAEAVKACSGPCGRELPPSGFPLDRRLRGGRRSQCKDCYRASRGPRGKEGRLAQGLGRELAGLLSIYSTPSLSDVLRRALEEVRQIGAAGGQRDEQVRAVRHAVLIQGCRRVEEVVEETRLSRPVVDQVLRLLLRGRVLETRDAFLLGDEAGEPGRPVVEYHPRAYPRGDGFRHLFRRDEDEPHGLEVEP